MKMMRFMLGVLPLAFMPPAFAENAGKAFDYGTRYQEVVAAYQAGDIPAMEAAVDAALQVRPDYPPMLEIKAMAESLAGKHTTAIATLAKIADMHIRFDPERKEFSALEGKPGFAALLARNRGLDRQAGAAEVAARGGRADFIPEGIAVDASGHIYLGSIRHGEILRANETVTTIHATRGRHWSVFGMGAVGNTLWFVSSKVPEFAGEEVAGAAANSGLFRLDLESGKLARYLLPAATALGDLIVDGSTVYLSDAAGGVWKFSEGEFTELLPKGMLVNPQGLALIDGKLVVADYRGGLTWLDPASGEYGKVGNSTSASLYGIDGLAAKGNRLFTVQNGISPARVTEFVFSPDENTITAARIMLMNHPDFDEPTLLTVRDDELLVVANSHWNRFDRNGELPADLAKTLSPPTVLSIAID